MKIAIFYHCLFALGDPPELLPNAYAIVSDQMDKLNRSGLIEAAEEIHIGINGGEESEDFATLTLPRKAKFHFHGLHSHAENLTLVELERWLPKHPDWYVLYFHAKGATHDAASSYGNGVSRPWRETMMHYLVTNWRQCVADLNAGFESVGCHFMRGMGHDRSQNIWAGNFWWAKAGYLLTLPTIFKRDRIKVSGISALESRYEAEVWIGNGQRLPRVKEYLPSGGGGVP